MRPALAVAALAVVACTTIVLPGGAPDASQDGAGELAGDGGTRTAPGATAGPSDTPTPSPDAGGEHVDSTRQAISGSRLKVRALVGADGAEQFWGWRDTARDEDCVFQLASDRKTRCLPTGLYQPSAIAFFSDAGCTLRIFQKTSACTPPPKYAGVNPVVPECTLAGTAVFPIGAVISPAPTKVYYLAGSCMQATASGDYYAAGVEVAPSDFVEATEQLR